jgi:hypothetical protein
MVMKRYGIVSLAVLFLVGCRNQRLAALFPEKPILGDTITFTYNPNAPGAKLHGKKQVSLDLVVTPRPSVRNSACSSGREYEMQWENNVWTKKVLLTDSASPFLLYWFSTDIGDSTVFDRRSEFQSLIYDNRGISLPSAHILAGFQKSAVKDWRHTEMLEEIKIHPTNYRAYYVLWYDQLRQSGDWTRECINIRRIVDSVSERYHENLDALVGCANAYRLLGDIVKAESLEYRILALFPLSSDAAILRWGKAKGETNPEKRAALLYELLMQFPSTDVAISAFRLIESYYASKQDSTTPRIIEEDWKIIRSGYQFQ